MLDILERLCAGQGKKGDIEELRHLAEIVKKGPAVLLGKSEVVDVDLAKRRRTRFLLL
jgi:NADH:ubiquinone oxidoreductase subunit F (NADH-binding)